MNTVNEVFDKLGGTTKAAAVLNIKQSAASEMKRRGSIPVKYWPDLVPALKAAGVRRASCALLVSIHTGREVM